MKRILAACFILLGSVQAYASSPASILNYQRQYVSVGIGDFFSRSDGNNHLNTGAGWPDDRYTQTGSSDQPLAYVGGGYIWDRHTPWLPSYRFGLRLMYVSAVTMSGVVDQYSLPDFRNYHYSYDVSLFNLFGTARADVYHWRSLTPYFMLGAGVTNYSASNYRETATANVTPRVSPDFNGGSGNVFAYQFGVGADWAALENMSVNVEFNYTNYGTVNSGNGANYTTLTGTNYDNESLSNKLAGTAVLVGLTFYPA